LCRYLYAELILGLVGTGSIAREVAAKAQALGMSIIATGSERFTEQTAQRSARRRGKSSTRSMHSAPTKPPGRLLESAEKETRGNPVPDDYGASPWL